MQLPLRDVILKTTHLAAWLTGSTLAPAIDGSSAVSSTVISSGALSGEHTSNRTTPFNDDFERLVADSLESYHVPGIAIAVYNGQDIWARRFVKILPEPQTPRFHLVDVKLNQLSLNMMGYGDATLNSTPADSTTLWLVGSTTKAFTAAAMSLIVDDDVNFPGIDWDTPISHILGEDFVLQDDYITTHATIRDALTHRTGMPRHDSSYGAGGRGRPWTPKDYTRNLRNLPLTHELRAKWQYCNMMYVVVTQVIETLTGYSLEEVITQRILTPLEMNSTYFSTKIARRAPAHLANGYYYENHTFHEVEDQDLSETYGEGFIVSSVVDYAKWIQSLINRSGPLSQAGYREIFKPHMLLDEASEPMAIGAYSYALGWDTSVYRGHQYYKHTGGMASFGANVILLPDLKLGLVGFANTAGSSNGLEETLMWHLIDEHLGVPKEQRFDWNSHNAAKLQKLRSTYAAAKDTFYPAIPTPPLPLTVPLAAHAGTYNNAGYQNLSVFVTSQRTLRVLKESDWAIEIDLEHVSGEYFLGRADLVNAPSEWMREALPVEFRVGPDGAVAHVGIRFEPAMGSTKIWFDRV